jgi:hypothetical protein
VDGEHRYLFDLTDYDSATLSAARHQLLADVRRSIAWSWLPEHRLPIVRRLRGQFARYGGPNRIHHGLEKALSERWTVVLQYSWTDNDARSLTSPIDAIFFAGVEAT